MYRTLLIGSALVVLVFTGVVHGLWTDRWSEMKDLSEAADCLDKIPAAIGAWQGKTVKLDDSTDLGLAGTLARRYVHGSTGKAVTLYLACGRPGPVGTHTPDVCYQGSGYQMHTQKRFQLPAVNSPNPPEFLTARFDKTKADSQSSLRIFWSWLAGGGWKVAENPRLAFAGEAVVHKMYLIRDLTTPDEPVETDPCVEFMHDLLPVLQRTLYQDPR